MDGSFHVTRFEPLDVGLVTVEVFMYGDTIDTDFHGAFDVGFVVYQMCHPSPPERRPLDVSDLDFQGPVVKVYRNRR